MAVLELAGVVGTVVEVVGIVVEVVGTVVVAVAVVAKQPRKED